MNLSRYKLTEYCEVCFRHYSKYSFLQLFQYFNEVKGLIRIIPDAFSVSTKGVRHFVD